jgi:hypothetical protein
MGEYIRASLVTKHQLWVDQVPNFSFEYGEDDLLELALSRDFVRATHTKDEEGEELYMMNPMYRGIS